MKIKLFFIAIVSSTILFVSCSSEVEKEETVPSVSTDVINVPSTASDKPAEPGSAAIITFNEDKHDFGKLTQGEKVTWSFVFKNTGGTDLVISSAQGSCGCTVPTYPHVPIKPGETSKVDVVFDSEGKSGLVQKTVTLVTNCNPSTKVLSIAATVIVPESE